MRTLYILEYFEFFGRLMARHSRPTPYIGPAPATTFCFVHAGSISSGSMESTPSIAASVVGFKRSFSKILEQATESSRQNLSGSSLWEPANPKFEDRNAGPSTSAGSGRHIPPLCAGKQASRKHRSVNGEPEPCGRSLRTFLPMTGHVEREER